MTSDLDELLAEAHPALVTWIERRMGRLARFETAEDLAQGVALRAVDRGESFEWRGRREAYAWLLRVARGYLVDRHAYWLALRRNPGALLRITSGVETGASARAAEPPADATGPATFAERRERLDAAYAALAALLPRDQELVRLTIEGATIREMADALELSYDAVERARLRALDRLRKVHRIAGLTDRR